MLKQLLDDLQYLLDRITKIERMIEDRMLVHQGCRQQVLLDPWRRPCWTWALIAEIGTDMSVFGDAAYLCSWAAVCPSNNEIAGERQSGRTTKRLTQRSNNSAMKSRSYLARPRL
jgi:hypothetical protein